jgi:hypothetical protein
MKMMLEEQSHNYTADYRDRLAIFAIEPAVGVLIGTLTFVPPKMESKP